ncbi:hypothetical protein [Falsiroseomonas sp. HW251]|uniref:hypothetical protein n=1 Tax=Falsiroseomonas sp. HW251 TaxID=3390998 RepID=UPI003D31D757
MSGPNKQVGLGFFTPNEVRLTFGGRQLDVDFSQADVSRLIVIEPAIRQMLPFIMSTHDHAWISWGELRSRLEDRGLNLQGEIARNRAGPAKVSKMNSLVSDRHAPVRSHLPEGVPGDRPGEGDAH